MRTAIMIYYKQLKIALVVYCQSAAAAAEGMTCGSWSQ
jgi:hypothetical protein